MIRRSWRWFHRKPPVGFSPAMHVAGAVAVAPLVVMAVVGVLYDVWFFTHGGWR